MNRDWKGLAAYRNEEEHLRTEFDEHLSDHKYNPLIAKVQSEKRSEDKASDRIYALKSGKQGFNKVRHINKVNRVSEIYSKDFSNLVPYFLRDFFPLLSEFEFRSYAAGEIIYDFDEVPTTFYLIKAGSVKFED